MTVLILAAGQQERWGKYPIKQLLKIGDETIIGRTVRQLKDWDLKSIIVTCNGDIKKGFDFSIRYFCPASSRWTVETLEESYHLWGDERKTILLGDVIYSYKTLNLILYCQEDIRWFGNPWEIFAFSFTPKKASRVNDFLWRTIHKAERGECPGKLRNFFHTYCDIEQEEDIFHPHFELIDSINDYTNDIDSPEEYEAFLREHLAAMQHDDNQHFR